MPRVLLKAEHQRTHTRVASERLQNHPTLRERARLVEEERAAASERLQRVRTLDENPPPRRAANRHGERERRGHCQRAGAGHHEQGDGVIDGHKGIAPPPDAGGHNGQHQDNGNEVARNPIGEQHDRRPLTGTLLDIAEQAAEAARDASFLHTHAEWRRKIGRAGIDLLALGHRHGARLAGQQREVERRTPALHHAVGGEGVAGPHVELHSRQHGLARHLTHHSALHHPRRGRCERPKQCGGVRRGTLRAVL